MSLGGIILNAAATFGFFVLAGRTLGPTNAAAVFEGIAVLTICSFAAMFGGDSGLLRLMPRIRRELPGREFQLSVAALLPSLIIGLLICFAILALRIDVAQLVVRHGNRQATAQVLAVVAPFIPIGALMSVALAGVRTWSVRDMVLVQYLAIPIARLGILGCLTTVGITPRLAAIAWTAPMVGGGVVACWYVLSRSHKAKSSEAPATTSANRTRVSLELWRFSGPRTLSGVFQVLVAWLDVLLVGAMASGRQSAAYAVASRYVVTGTFALSAMAIAIAPQLSRLFDRKELDTAQTLYRESTWWVMAATWPTLGLLVVFAPFLMHLFGSGYGAGVTSLEILGLAMLLNTGTGSNGVALLMSGGSGVNLSISAMSLILNVGLNLVLIPRYGAEGAAIAWTGSIAFSSVVTTLMVYRRTRLQPFGGGYAAVVTAAVVADGVAAVSCRLLLGTGLVATLAGTAACTVLFVAILWRFRFVLRLEDLRRVVFRSGSESGDEEGSIVEAIG